MFAVGEIEQMQNSAGQLLVRLWIDGVNRHFGLTNLDDFPESHPLFGLFLYNEADKTCCWVSPKTIEE